MMLVRMCAVVSGRAREGSYFSGSPLPSPFASFYSLLFLVLSMIYAPQMVFYMYIGLENCRIPFDVFVASGG